MIQRELGASGSRISVVGYGAWEAGGDQWRASISHERIIGAMHAAFDEGIDWIDTAETYGHGRSEEVVGRALRGHEQVMAFTKVAPRLAEAASIRGAFALSPSPRGEVVGA